MRNLQIRLDMHAYLAAIKLQRESIGIFTKNISSGVNLNKQLVLKRSVIAVALTLASSHVVMAQNAATPAPAATPTVYVTGSNLKRSDREGTSPVQTLTAKDIKDSGAASVMELLREIPSMGSDNNLDVNDGGFSRGAATASLRGLTSTSTLILLNGRRIAPAAYADPNTGNSTLYDLNSIPLSALERVEILKDGASAVYGSDAIGGVINFITKSNYNGAELSARASTNDDGQFGRKGVTAVFGMGDLEEKGWSFFVTGDLNDRARTARTDVRDIEYNTYSVLNGRFATPYGSTVSARPQFFRESSPGSRNFAVTRTTMADRLRVPTDCPVSEQLVGSAAMAFTPTSVYFGRTFCNYNTNQFLEGQGAGKDGSVLSVAKLKLGKNTTAFAEFAFSRSERSYTAAPITLGQTQVTNFTSSAVGTPFQAILEIGHPDNPFPTARASVAYRFENLKAGNTVVNENTRLLLGAQGTIGSWDWDSGLLWNESAKDDTFRGRLYLPTLRKLNTGTSLAALAADPTIGRDVTNTGASTLMTFDVKASTQIGNLPGGKIGLAIGGQFMRDSLKLDPDADLAAGRIYGLANSIIDGERDNKSVFVETSVPFLKSFEMNFAGRYDKYDGLKGNFVPKVGAKWTVTSGFVARMSYGEGFRVPALNQVTPGGSQFFLTGIDDPKRCELDGRTPKPGATEVDCNKSAAGTGGANPLLVPEKSRGLTMGVIWSPNSNFDILLDYFKIRKENEVALASTAQALKEEDQFPDNVVRDTNPVNFILDAQGRPIPGTGPLLMVKRPWINQGATQVSGFDLEMRYRIKLGDMGTLSTKLNTTYLDEYLLAELPGRVENNVAGGRAGIWDWQLNSGIDNPRWKTQISAAWNYGVHNFSANLNYVGKLSLLRVVDADITYAQPFCHYGVAKTTDGAADRNLSIPLYEAYFPECAVNSWTTVGAGYSYNGFKNLSLNFNIRNLLDKKAPYDPGYATTGYNSDLHNGYGRYFSVSARYKF